MSSIIIRKAKKITETLLAEDRTIVVFKGIPVEGDINLDSIVENKFAYFSTLMNEGRKIITYEEFLLLKDFIISQYQTIYIVENNLYINYYPLDLRCNEDTRTGILNNFIDVEDDSQDEREIVTNDIINLYRGVKEKYGYCFGSYMEDESEIVSDKIQTVPLFEKQAELVFSNSVEQDAQVINIQDEEDYIDFIKKLLGTPDELYIRIDNYTADINLLKDRLKYICQYFPDYTEIHLITFKAEETQIENSEEIAAILKKYWGYDSYKPLSVYDIAQLDEGRKVLREITQENIISDLIVQAEKWSENSLDARDVFVTAPTGAGKSVMFQIPAIYLAEKHDLLTIVISPLIGLMNDQVGNLSDKNYGAVATINSDINEIVRKDIIAKVADGSCNILYISPETLLSRGDVEMLVGDRTIGMIVIDEAHIVTTWGKQFRPDYWLLGDHIRKLRKNQEEKKKKSFLISTFTATAIYGGKEDMYTETRNSLNMIDPIVYLSSVKRDDIEIRVATPNKIPDTSNKYVEQKVEFIKKLIFKVGDQKKLLVYFPTIGKIDKLYTHLESIGMAGRIVKYYSGDNSNRESKEKAYEDFKNGTKNIMFATKGFGMGIDIDDIDIVAHYAPTGNVCDYVQEIGRAARKDGMNGEAIYQFNKSFDFRPVNRLHNGSIIKKYQLIAIFKKIVELHAEAAAQRGKKFISRKRNALLVDAENFTHIFSSDGSNEINKVKTALLLIQKDFINRNGFSPVVIRPIALYQYGYFEIEKAVYNKLNSKYPGAVTEIDAKKNIYRLDLKHIWGKSYDMFSFANFKRLIFTNSDELDFTVKPVVCVDINFNKDSETRYNNVINELKKIVNQYVRSETRVTSEELKKQFTIVPEHQANTIIEVFLSSVNAYRSGGTTKVMRDYPTNSGKTEYIFYPAIDDYFKWIDNNYRNIRRNVEDNRLYVTNNSKAINTVLGILEVFDVLSFKTTGGESSQLYIYVNQLIDLKNYVAKPSSYRNALLDDINERHKISNEMLTYLFSGGKDSDRIWEDIEDYFLGNVPEEVKT